MMAAQGHTLDLTRMALSPGQGTRLDLELSPGAVELGGSTYSFDGDRVPARIDVSRTAAGHALRLRFAGELAGPCMRCLEPARIPIEVEAREVDQPSAEDEDLLSPYVTEGEVDLAAWAHDSLILELPQQLLCRPDCAGLCPVCGVSLNDADPAEHEHEPAPDPRWEKLRELKLEE